MTITSHQRIEALDVLRGVAVCGILLMTIVKMGSLTDYALDPTARHWDAPWVAWVVQTVFVDGAMRGLFTMLFGASMVLMLRRAEGAQGSVAPIDVWARRSLALMAFGMILWLGLLWPGEILWNYGLSGLFLLAFRTSASRVLLGTAAAMLLLLSVNNAYRTHQAVSQLQQGRAAIATGPAQSPAAIAARAEYAQVHPADAEVERRLVQRTHLRSLVKWSEQFWSGENIGRSGWLEVAESVSFMLIGMALFRMGVLTGAAPAATYRWMMVMGYGGGIALRGAAAWLGARSGLDLTSPVVGPIAWAVSDALFEPGRLLMTLGHAGAILTLFARGWFGRATPLRALGRMALTVYALQAVIGSLLFYGLGLVGRFDLIGLWGIAVMIWIATGAFSLWWLARFEIGPTERLLRTIAYGRGADAAKTMPATV